MRGMAWTARIPRAKIAFLHDIVMAAISFPLSLWLRIGYFPVSFRTGYLFETSLIFAAVCGVVFLAFRLYRGVWRYASLNDLLAITKAVSVAILLAVPILFFFSRLEFIPRSLPFINWFVLLALLGGPRFLYRLLKDKNVVTGARSDMRRIPVLLVGGGDECELFIRGTRGDGNSPYTPVAILSEKRHRVGSAIHGVPVTGTLDDLEKLLTGKGFTMRPEKIVITRDGIDGAKLRSMVDVAERLGVPIARMPRISELKSGFADSSIEVRPVAVEDLLGRPQASLDRAAISALVSGRRVLVTGAGGSIGSELVRQIAALGPSELALMDAAEFNLYTIDREMHERFPEVPRRAILGDVRDRDRVRDVFSRVRPELVFHAAALKHVPMVEANPLEGLLTNAVGSRIVADACREAGVRCMVQISTDKAVNPTNVMGATKRLAEAYIQTLDTVCREGGEPTRYVVVRFGNVLGSTGSVVPLFQRQLAAGGPLTVTHPEVTRYFMTIKEAVELVMQASALGVSDDGSKGRIFVLDMGEPVKIVDLARQMIYLAGLKPDEDVKIEIVGLRPGEKLYEELLHTQESLIPSAADGLMLAAPRTGSHEDVAQAFDRLETLARARQREQALAILSEFVPEYVVKGDVAGSSETGLENKGAVAE